MKKISKLLVTLLMLIFMVGMMGGCSSKAKETNEGENSKKEDQKSSSDETEKVRMWIPFSPSDQASTPEDMVYWQKIQEATGVDIEFISSTGGKEALSILVASNDLPDIVCEWDGNMPGGVQKSLSEETIIPLNDLIQDGKMPNFKAYLDKDAEVDKLIKNDNGLYAWAPMIRLPDSPLAFNGVMVRKDWLDDLGLAIPTTVAELENVLIQFRDSKGATAGYSVAWNNYSRLVMSYGIVEGFYVDESNTVKYGFLQDEYKDFIKLFNSWLDKGILDPDMFTQGIDSFYAKIASGQTGVVWGNTGGELGKIETMKAEDPSMNFVAVPNPVLNKGETFPVDISNYRVNNIGYMITSNSKNVDAAAKVVDYIYGEEGNMLSNYGVEGITYEMVNGVPTFTDYVLNNEKGLSIEQALAFYAGDKNKPFLLEKQYLEQTYALQQQIDSLDVWSTPDAKIKQMPPVSMTEEEANEFSRIMGDINTYTDEMKLKFIMGTEPMDNIDSFTNNLRKLEVEKAIQIQQDAYNRYLNR